MTTDLRDAIASAIDEAVLRVTDGSVRFDGSQLNRIADEFLWGEVFGLGATIEAAARGARILLVERPVPVFSRRSAPTVDEVWAAHPELHARHLRALDAVDDGDQKWALVPQPLYSPDLSFEDLPKRIIRQCCQSKTCGGTDLYLDKSDTPTGSYYSYRRGSNDEAHMATGATTVAELVTQLNDPAWWPNQWSTVPFEYAGADTDYNAPEGTGRRDG